MSTAIPDLWPANLGVTGPPPPVAVLRKQAAALAEKSAGAVVGAIRSAAWPFSEGGQRITHRFVIKAPLIGFEFDAFRVTHGLQSYPLWFGADDRVVHDWLQNNPSPGISLTEFDAENGGIEATASSPRQPGKRLFAVRCDYENSYIDVLRKLLNSSPIVESVNSLIAQGSDADT